MPNKDCKIRGVHKTSHRFRIRLEDFRKKVTPDNSSNSNSLDLTVNADAQIYACLIVCTFRHILLKHLGGGCHRFLQFRHGNAPRRTLHSDQVVQREFHMEAAYHL